MYMYIFNLYSIIFVLQISLVHPDCAEYTRTVQPVRAVRVCVFVYVFVLCIHVRCSKYLPNHKLFRTIENLQLFPFCLLC